MYFATAITERIMDTVTLVLISGSFIGAKEHAGAAADPGQSHGDVTAPAGVCISWHPASSRAHGMPYRLPPGH